MNERSLRRAAIALAIALAGGLGSLPAQATTTIVAVGDSITDGLTHSGPLGGDAAAAGRDPGGGYPGRLAAELKGTRILKRGAGGATTGFWLDPPAADPATVKQFLEALWPDFRPARDPAPRESILAYVLATDRPDVVLVLVGANDLLERRGATPAAPAVVERLGRMAALARAAGARVLIATLPPNRRDPAAVIAEINRRLCEAEPDCVRVDRRFAKSGEASRASDPLGDLLGDEIHPTEKGHARIAAAFAEALAPLLNPPASPAPPSPRSTPSPRPGLESPHSP